MLHTDADFLTAIAANPGDRTLHLVYADWLDEHSQPHGELVRIEEEMRELPVFADRFWELKPRRNVLREQIGAEWCGKMRYGTECEPVFRHGIPDGWLERWRLIREFTERWHQIPMSDIGGRQAEIAETEEKLGRKLPPSVREWIAFAHDVRQSADYHDVLRDVYQMEDVPGHPAVSLLLQAEGDYHWAVRRCDLDEPDPPVQGYHWDHENRDENTWVPDAENSLRDSVTVFALGYSMGYGRGESGFGTGVEEPTQLLRDLDAAFGAPLKFGSEHLYEADNFLLSISSHVWRAGVYLRVAVARQIPHEQIPAFLWKYTRSGGSFYGMFTPPR